MRSDSISWDKRTLLCFTTNIIDFFPLFLFIKLPLLTPTLLKLLLLPTSNQWQSLSRGNAVKSYISYREKKWVLDWQRWAARAVIMSFWDTADIKDPAHKLSNSWSNICLRIASNANQDFLTFTAFDTLMFYLETLNTLYIWKSQGGRKSDSILWIGWEIRFSSFQLELLWPRSSERE